MMSFASLPKIVGPGTVNRCLNAQTTLRSGCRWDCLSELRTFTPVSNLSVASHASDNVSSRWRRRTTVTTTTTTSSPASSSDSSQRLFQSFHGRHAFSVSAVDPFRLGSPLLSSVDPPKKKLSLAKRFKKLVKDYWYVIIPVHMVTSCVWFGGFYYLACSGINLPDLLHSCGAPDEWVQRIESHLEAGNLIMAITLYKIAVPFRYMVTLGCTTLSLKYLTRWGWIKPVPNKEQIRKIYEEQKGALKDLKEAIHMTKDDLIKTKKEVTQQYKDAREGFARTVDEGRKDIAEGVKMAKEEWKHVGKLFVKELKKSVAKKRKD